jgi:hypothetical protein
MATRIYIYGYTPFGSIQRLLGLEDALNDLLQDLGHVEINEDCGPGWNVELLVQDDERVEHFTERLIDFLQGWHVPADTTVAITTFPEDGAGWAHRTLEISGKVRQVRLCW